MLSRRMLTHKAVQERLEQQGNISRTVVYKQVIAGSLQPISDKAALEYSLIPGKAFKFYTNETDFNVGDVLTIATRRYSVKGYNVLDGFGNASHTEVLLDLAA